MTHRAAPLAFASVVLAALAGCPTGGNGDLPNGFSTTPPNGVPADAACTTDTWWVDGDEESELMHPGVDCISCHAREDEGPRYVSAGTVMGATDDHDDCQGIGDVTVRIIDANGDAHETLSNAAGNFYFEDVTIPTPYTVQIESGGVQTNQMLTPQTDLNCMTCHTDVGANAAPGRIVAQP